MYNLSGFILARRLAERVKKATELQKECQEKIDHILGQEGKQLLNHKCMLKHCYIMLPTSKCIYVNVSLINCYFKLREHVPQPNL